MQPIEMHREIRTLLINNVHALQAGVMPASVAMAAAASLKVVSDHIQVEINALKAGLVLADDTRTIEGSPAIKELPDNPTN